MSKQLDTSFGESYKRFTKTMRRLTLLSYEDYIVITYAGRRKYGQN